MALQEKIVQEEHGRWAPHRTHLSRDDVAVGFTGPRPVVHYPDSDGQPMAENDPQYYTITDARFALERKFIDDSNVYVGADLLVYYEEGNVGKRVAPDVFVAFGVSRDVRRIYRVWVEGKAPDVVFEIASEGTWREDLGRKYTLYETLGVREYFIFDPLSELIHPALQGYRLARGAYHPISPLSETRGEEGFFSRELNLEIWMRPNLTWMASKMPYVLRFYDPDSESWLLTPDETNEALMHSKKWAEAEGKRAEAEAKRAETEAKRADVEATARRLVEAEAARLRAELDRLKSKPR